MPSPLFRVKRSAHPKYKFLARCKVNGKWRRRYFGTEAEAIAFSRQQNEGLKSKEKHPPKRHGERTKPKRALASATIRGHEIVAYADNNFTQLNEPIYTGPRIHRYFGDHWSMHLPFAYDLMRELRPEVFVELGVWKGESYFTFCQSAADHQIATQCYGIDTWRGDVHMGDFDPEIGIEVAEYNWRYSSFSELHATTFMEALDEFVDGTIDLLHIDGAHTYEEVKRDFESWLPKVSAGGVVLFHDVALHDRGFGVWRLWEEIARPGRSFLFEFGYGLGVWKKLPVTKRDSAWLRRLFLPNRAEHKRINAFYATAATALALWHEAERRKNRDAMARPLHMQLFVDQGGGFSEGSSVRAALVAGQWQSIRFDHLEKLRPKRGGRIRLDPVDCSGFVNISAIRLVTDSDNEVFYSASSATDFAQIKVSEKVLKQEADGILSLVTTTNDSQIFLPELNFPTNDSWHLEVELEVHPAPPNVIARQAAHNSGLAAELGVARSRLLVLEAAAETWDKFFAGLRASLEASQAEVGRLSAQNQTADAATQTLQNANAEAGTRIAQLERTLEEERKKAVADASQRAGELAEAGSRNTEQELRLAQQIQEITKLEAEVRNLQDTVDQARANSDRLVSEVDLERAQNGAHQARAEDYTRQITALDGALQGAIEQARANSTQLSAELETERAQRLEQQGKAEDYATQVTALDSEVRGLHAVIEQAQTNSNQLSAELETERAQKREQQARAEDYATQVTALDSEVRSLHAVVEQAQTSSNQLSAELETERARTLDYEERLGNAENQNGLLESELQEERSVFAAEVRNVEKAIGETRALAIEVTTALESERFENRQHQAQAERDNQKIASLTSEVNALRSGIKQARAESAQLSSKLQKTTGLLEASADRAMRLSGVLEIRKSHSAGLQLYTARLEHRLDDVSHRMRAAAEALKQGDSDAPAIVNLISEDIRRIHDPSFWWKTAKALGILRFAHIGVPRTAEERRALARELRAGLREMCRTLCSTTTAPEEAAAEISRLFKLRRQTREILQSLKLSSLVGLKSPKWHIVHWARQTASSLSGMMPASALFDTAWYLGHYPDVAASDVDPLQHYLRWGAKEGRDPNPLFNTAWYLEKNLDVAAAEINPLKHYWDSGAREGRDPSPYFSTTWYLAKNPDIAAAGLNPLQHYLAHGAREGRDPHPLFNSAWYLSQNPEVAGLNPAEHYLQWGRSHGLSPHPLSNSK